MRDRVDENEAETWIAGPRLRNTPPLAPRGMSNVELAIAFTVAIDPVLDGRLLELNEDSLAMHLGRRQKLELAASKRDAAILKVLFVERRVDARESKQRLDFAQPVYENDALDHSFETCWRDGRPRCEV